MTILGQEERAVAAREHIRGTRTRPVRGIVRRSDDEVHIPVAVDIARGRDRTSEVIVGRLSMELVQHAPVAARVDRKSVV